MINYTFISKTALFEGVSEKETEGMLACLCASSRTFKKDEVIYRAGDFVQQMGLVLTGGVHIVSYSAWGSQDILDYVPVGQVFAEAYACNPKEPLMVSVIAAEATEILFLDINRVLKTCSAACAHHGRLLRNLLSVMAMKNLNLTRKIHYITPRAIRERLLAYLSFEAVRQSSYSFCIPFDRQQLADYLAVERSALSNELSKMQRDGLISYKKNHFVLHSKAPSHLLD